MKKLLIAFSILLGIAIFFYPTKTISFGGGSPGGKTGSPNDIATNPNQNACNSCHYAAIGDVNDVSITTNIPSSGWTPNSIYTITTSIQNSTITKFGFELTSERAGDFIKYGTFLLTNPTETKFVNNNNAITHTSSGNQGVGSKSWTVDWQAPSSTDDDVIFYASFIAANNDGGNGGDTFYNTSLQIPADWTTSINEKNNVFTIKDNKFISDVDCKHILIYDLTGKLIYSNNNIIANKQIDLSQFKNSVYLFKIIDTKGNTISNKIRLD